MNTNSLIELAQLGGYEGKAAANELLYHIAEKYHDRKLQKYFATGMSYADHEEIRQIFLLGCYQAILDASLDIGDPLAFILNKGIWAVADAIRRDSKKNLQQQCPNCHKTERLNRIRGIYTCSRCGSNQAELLQRVIPHSNNGEEREANNKICYWLEENPEGATQLLLCYLQTAWGVESGLSHKADFESDQYRAVIQVVDPEIIITALERIYSDLLNVEQYPEFTDTPLELKTAQQFVWLHKKFSTNK